MICLLHSDSHCSVILKLIGEEGCSCVFVVSTHTQTHTCVIFSSPDDLISPSLLAYLINQTNHGNKCKYIFKRPFKANNTLHVTLCKVGSFTVKKSTPDCNHLLAQRWHFVGSFVGPTSTNDVSTTDVILLIGPT